MLRFKINQMGAFLFVLNDKIIYYYKQVVDAIHRVGKLTSHVQRALPLNPQGLLALDLVGASPLNPTRASRPGPAWLFVCQGLRPCTPPGALPPGPLAGGLYPPAPPYAHDVHYLTYDVLYLVNKSIDWST